MRSLRFIYLSSLVILISACGPSPEELAPTIVAQTEAARRTATAEIQQALAAIMTGTASAITPSPTPSPLPTETPTLTPTITPTPLPSGDVIEENTNLRAGPGIGYKILDDLPVGTTVELIGQDEGGDWVQVNLEDGQQGWVLLRLLEVDGDAANLPISEAPPTPQNKVTITIVNNTNSYFLFWIIDITKEVTIKANESMSFTVDKGEYSFTYGIPTIYYCRRVPGAIFTDIIWTVPDRDPCVSFP